MSDFGDIKNITTRKDHKCIWCAQVIPKGSQVECFSGRYDNAWSHWHMHPECSAAHDRESREVGDDSFMPYSHLRGMTDGEAPAPARKTI